MTTKSPWEPIFRRKLKYGDQFTPGSIIGSMNGTASPGAIAVSVTLPTPTVIAEIRYCDDFNRADNVNLGGSWVEGGAGEMRILSNELAGNGSGLSSAMFNTALTDDHMAEWDVTLGDAQSFYVRASQTSGPGVSGWISYEWFWTSASGGTWTLRRYTAPSSVTTINTFTGLSTPNGQRMRFEVEGTALRVFRNGVSQVSTTDSNITSGQYAGIREDNNTMAVDNACFGPI